MDGHATTQPKKEDGRGRGQEDVGLLGKLLFRTLCKPGILCALGWLKLSDDDTMTSFVATRNAAQER